MGAAGEGTSWLAPLWASLLQPFTDPASRTWWVGLAVTLVLALVLVRPRSWARLAALALHRSSLLDVQLLASGQLLGALGVIPALGGGWWLATALVRSLDATVGAPALDWGPGIVVPLYTVATFVAWDLSRYVVHRLMHEVPALWAVHQVHHSAEVLTPLTFHRVHPLESVIYALRGAVVSGALAGGFYWAFRDGATLWSIGGVHAVGLLANVATGNLRHSHVWLRFGPLERWLISPAQHQLHHARAGALGNYGSALALWDRLFGTLLLSAGRRPARVGLPRGERNHASNALSMLVAPVGAALRTLAPKTARPAPARLGTPSRG